MSKGNAVLMVGGLAVLALGLSRKAAAATGAGGVGFGAVRDLARGTTAAYFPQVSWEMLVAMAWVESNFQPDAFRWEPHIGDLGDASVGIMQTLLSTATWLHDDMGARAMGRPSYDALRDPAVSMYFGAAMVNWLRRYGGTARSERWIVESYNGGPGASNAGTENHWRKYLLAKEQFGL